MEKVFYTGLVIVFIAGLNVCANIMAQRIYPTFSGDGIGRGFSYRVVFAFCILALLFVCMVGLLLLNAAGFTV